MTRYVGFLRNVMIGREGLHRVVLLDRVAAAGGGKPVSFVSTGNVAFELAPVDLERFVRDLDAAIEAIIGRHEPVYVRKLADLRRIVASAPFAKTPFEDAVERVISFARNTIPMPEELPVFSRRRDACVFRIDGTEAYCVSRMVDGRTSGAGGLAEHIAGAKVTTRSWGTVSRIVAKETTDT